MTNQGRTLPSSRSAPKVSALGKRVARLRHVIRDNRVLLESVAVAAVFAGSCWVLLVLLIGAVPLNR